MQSSSTLSMASLFFGSVAALRGSTTAFGDEVADRLAAFAFARGPSSFVFAAALGVLATVPPVVGVVRSRPRRDEAARVSRGRRDEPSVCCTPGPHTPAKLPLSVPNRVTVEQPHQAKCRHRTPSHAEAPSRSLPESLCRPRFAPPGEGGHVRGIDGQSPVRAPTRFQARRPSSNDRSVSSHRFPSATARDAGRAARIGRTPTVRKASFKNRF